MTRVAAVDCGTNTIKLLVADLDPVTGKEAVRVRETRMVRLGQDVDRTGRLAEAALGRVFGAVEEYAGIVARERPERIRFCATSAARDASNAAVFALGVRERLGVVPEVVSGAEEAALSYDGATRALVDVTAPVVVLDIGGGSTEVVLGSGHGDVRAAWSLDVGSVRMTERHLRSDPPPAGGVEAARAEIDAALDTLPEHGIELGCTGTLVAVSGTGLTVAAAALDLDALDETVLDGAVVPTVEVRLAASRLLGMTVAARRELPYMHPGRADVIGAGALILDRVLARVPVHELRVSVRDILDGIAWSRV